MIVSFFGFLFYYSADVANQEIIEYSELCADQDTKCFINFTPKNDMTRPFLYYELDNFYSNYRSVVKTKPIF